MRARIIADGINFKFSRVWNIGFNQIYPEGGIGIVYHVSKYSKINGELMRDGQWLCFHE